VERSGRRVAAQRIAGLFGRAHQRVGIVRMLGFLADNALERSLYGLQKPHALRLHYLKNAAMAACSALKSASSGPIFSSGMPSAAIAPASSAPTSLAATIDSPVELTY